MNDIPVITAYPSALHVMISLPGTAVARRNRSLTLHARKLSTCTRLKTASNKGGGNFRLLEVDGHRLR